MRLKCSLTALFPGFNKNIALGLQRLVGEHHSNLWPGESCTLVLKPPDFKMHSCYFEGTFFDSLTTTW